MLTIRTIWVHLKSILQGRVRPSINYRLIRRVIIMKYGNLFHRTAESQLCISLQHARPSTENNIDSSVMFVKGQFTQKQCFTLYLLTAVHSYKWCVPLLNPSTPERNKDRQWLKSSETLTLYRVTCLEVNTSEHVLSTMLLLSLAEVKCVVG